MDALISIQFLGQSVMLFGSVLSSHSKTISAKAVSFLNLYNKRSIQKALQF